MIGLIKEIDSFGDVSYFTIIGNSESNCFDQVCELNDHAYECKTGNQFRIVGYKMDGQWAFVNGEPMDSGYVNMVLKGQ